MLMSFKVFKYINLWLVSIDGDDGNLFVIFIVNSNSNGFYFVVVVVAIVVFAFDWFSWSLRPVYRSKIGGQYVITFNQMHDVSTPNIWAISSFWFWLLF